MMNELVTINSVPYSPIGAPGMLQLLPANPQRVFVIIGCGTGVALFYLSTRNDGGTATVFATVPIGSTQDWLRHDYGPLITGEWWASDAAGNSPDASFSVTEGILISGE